MRPPPSAVSAEDTVLLPPAEEASEERVRVSAGPVPDHVPAYLRSHGTLALRFEERAGATMLRQRQEGGCLRVRVPRFHEGRMAEAVVINTSGGLCGGDSLAQDVTWGPGTGSVLTTQAAEKVYGTQGPAVTMATRLAVGDGARAEWLPQETILFDGARLERDTCIDLAPDASLLWCEALTFGRIAHGETFVRGGLRDRVRLWRGGRLVHADVFDLGEAPGDRLQRTALGNGARACATVLAVGGLAVGGGWAARLEAVRAALERHGEVLAGASAWNGLVSVRLLAHDPAALRRALAEILGILREEDLPRVWRC